MGGHRDPPLLVFYCIGKLSDIVTVHCCACTPAGNGLKLATRVASRHSSSSSLTPGPPFTLTLISRPRLFTMNENGTLPVWLFSLASSGVRASMRTFFLQSAIHAA